jgi:stage V sporulation protein SpoVS
VSVREQLFIRTVKKPVEVAGMVAGLVGGRTKTANGGTWLLVAIGDLLPDEAWRGAVDFGGPVLTHESERPFRPAGEYTATDAYNVEIRLWLAGAHNDAVEAAAADRIFAAVAGLNMATIQIRRDDELIRAVLPGGAPYDFPAGTLIYETDRDRWNGYVVEG